MFKYVVVLFALIACAAAKPHILVAAPAPVVTATSSQVIARYYNGIAGAPVPLTASYVASPFAAPVLSHYAAAPLASHLW